MRALIVDDDELSLDILQGVLADMGHEVECAHDGKEALAKLQDGTIHLVITDWDMPSMNGVELCRAIRAGDFDGYVYVIMLTGKEGGQQKIEGLLCGADSFLNKPLNPDELLVSLKTAERILSLETRDLAMFALAKLSESRDPETGGHIERVQSYARTLAQYLSTTERYGDEIDGEFVRLIFQTSPLHDIGKVGIPDNVLLKPGKLTDQEMAVMRTHAALGARTLEASLQRFPNVRFLQMARDIAQSHHERWDGRGYPQGLAGKDIPLAARIVALADVYDALTSKRVYREAMPHAQAKKLIEKGRGEQFEPDVVDAFLRTERQFIAIRERFRDDEEIAGGGQKAVDAQKVMAELEVAEPTLPAAQKDDVLDRVMVVDDDPVALDLLRHFMVSQGMDVLACRGGDEALAALPTFRPRLIVSDWEMPTLDGLELCRRVRASASGPAGQHVHFVMLTVHTKLEELSKAFDAGADDFLAKPFTDADLMARLRSGLRAVALYDELSRQHQGSRKLNEQLTNLNSRLERLAITDDLTGLYNRRQAMHRLEEHWALGDRYQRPVAVVTLDIDHFKRLNDEHGHPAGDAVLRQVAEVLRGCVRATDTACRIGGEEFLVVLPNQTLQEAEFCGERCRAAVEARMFQADGKSLRLTISAGVASRRGDMHQCVELLAEADTALYAAKRSGRNAVRSARGDPAAHAA